MPIFGQYQFDHTKETKAWVSIQNQLETLAELVQESKYAMSAYPTSSRGGMMKCLRVSEQYGLLRIASIQNSYSLLNRCLEFGMTEIVYRE